MEDNLINVTAIKYLSGKIDKKTLLVLLGPTASGKTAISIATAKEFDGEIISADSRQVYRHMDIGTDKIPVSRRDGIPHYMLDVVDPSGRFTVADFKKQSEEIIDDIFKRNKLPILCGGTGLYINSICSNFSIPPESPEIRKEIYEYLEKEGKDALYERLIKIDPASAAKIHKNNIPYVVRAIEIFMSTGKPKSDMTSKPKYKYLKFGLYWPRKILFERIESRVDAQIKAGLIEETQKLLSMGFGKKLPAMSSLGYQEIIDYLDGKIPLEAAVSLLKKNTRNYAKRQMTWFKRDPDTVWYNLANVSIGKNLEY